MAQFNYDAYTKQQAARQQHTQTAGNGPEVHFLNEFLKGDGDFVVVRFPYHTMDDIMFETTHQITFPGKKYPSRVRCGGANCPLCAQGEKVSTRFFAKLLAYTIDDATGEVVRYNAVWDRPAMFADVDLKALIQEYGDLTEQLFKIKRSGSGTATRYITSIVMNKVVYNPEKYPADFSELEKVDAARILSKSIDQMQAAFNPEAAKTAAAETAGSGTPSIPAAPATLAEPAPATAAPVIDSQTPARQPRKYTF